VLKRELEPKTTGARAYNLTTRETMRRNRRKIKKKVLGRGLELPLG